MNTFLFGFEILLWCQSFTDIVLYHRLAAGITNVFQQKAAGRSPEPDRKPATTCNSSTCSTTKSKHNQEGQYHTYQLDKNSGWVYRRGSGGSICRILSSVVRA